MTGLLDGLWVDVDRHVAPAGGQLLSYYQRPSEFV